jgi:hypothetical protein
MLMPFTAQWVLNFAHLFSFNESVIQSGLLIILPPVIGMGMVSPLAIANLDATAENSGKKAGLVYAISTTGSATSETVAKATQDAVQKAQEQQKK